MIDGKMHKDEETGSRIYLVHDNGDKELIDIIDDQIFIATQVDQKTGCNNYDVDDKSIENFSYGNIKVKLLAKIDYSSWYKRVRLFTQTYSSYSESLTDWIRASIDMKVYYAYSILVDGNLNQSSGTSPGMAYGLNYYTHTIVDGSSIVFV